MFTRIEAKGYRCLREVSQALDPFEILVGANASGKSTFLDVVAFLGDFLTDGLKFAVEKRTSNFHDLVWGRSDNSFKLSVEAEVPPERLTPRFVELGYDSIRYEVAIRLDPRDETLRVEYERASIHSQEDPTGWPVLNRVGLNTGFLGEEDRTKSTREVNTNYSGLSSVQFDSNFPGASWLRESLREGIKSVELNPADLRDPSPIETGDSQKITGGRLGRTVAQLKDNRPSGFHDWLQHIRTALPDVRTIDSILRDGGRQRYVEVGYENGIRVPSWMLSEGTLRLLQLTILAYLPDFRGVYLVEEPENGVHPAALETIYQSLSSMYDAQVLVASQSPVLLSRAQPEQILCFSKTPNGTEIVPGSEHPALRDWQGEVSLGSMVASGILG